MCVLCMGHGTPTQESSANDLRDGQRIVGNKNNRKHKECRRPTPEWSLHNFIGYAKSIVPEVNILWTKLPVRILEKYSASSLRFNNRIIRPFVKLEI